MVSAPVDAKTQSKLAVIFGPGWRMTNCISPEGILLHGFLRRARGSGIMRTGQVVSELRSGARRSG
jgi:hypothetical protein